jgi:alpha-amylase/alpha-mannosidase (GH57 family)
MTPAPIALVVHGHFYQPPRENPWTDELDREPSAAPHHDWNARIHAECYRANAFARIHDSRGRIEAIVNNYARMSFNFGPTLARWLERHDSVAHARLRVAVDDQRARLGHSGGMAQAYAHPIVPLLSPRDRQTQLLWGLLDYRRRFGHDAEGLWLPETAVTPESLETLIDLGVKFTILAPEQIAAVRAPGQGKEWTVVDRDSLDTARAYRWPHRDGSGRAINIAVFDGPLSRSIAFGDIANRADALLGAVRSSADRSSVTGQRLVLCASDGELFGHHKKFADLTLAFASYVEAARQGIEVTNLGAYLDRHPPTWEARLAEGPEGEGTAWSCSHGVGRWRRDCGCSMAGPTSGWNQKWRAPLRDALDILRDAAADFFEDAASELLVDPWGARDAYGEVVDAGVAERDALLEAFARPARARAGAMEPRDRVRLLMELQRATLLMYSSCGWFFDDVAGLESSLVIRFGAHAIDLFQQAGGTPPVRDFLGKLAEAKSNKPAEGTGADVFRRVAGDRVTTRHAVAFSGVASLIGGSAGAVPPPGFDVQIVGARTAPSPDGATLAGRARVLSRRTGLSDEHPFAAVRRGSQGIDFECRVGAETFGLADLGAERHDLLVAAAIRKLLSADGESHGDIGLAKADDLVPLSPESSVASAGPWGDLRMIRLALATVHEPPPEQVGRARQRQQLFVVLLMGLLSRQRGTLPEDAAIVAGELLKAAELPPGDILRRRVEELVWEQIEAGTDPRAVAALAEKLGFSPEAIGAEVIAS